MALISAGKPLSSLPNFHSMSTDFRVAVYTAYLDDEKKQVLQLYGQRSDEVTRLHGNVLCDLPCDIENPALLVTGLLHFRQDENGLALFIFRRG
jgi:hypothetical protein